MRRSGGFPDYPLPPSAARVRLGQLAARVARLVERLAREGGGEDEWGELRGWQEEHDSLADALECLDRVLPSLERCGCGKVVHETVEGALRHARLLRLVDDRRDKRRVDVYECDVVRRPGVFHVGHDRGGPGQAHEIARKKSA